MLQFNTSFRLSYSTKSVILKSLYAECINKALFSVLRMNINPVP